MSRRKPGVLLPLETAILCEAMTMHRAGEAQFHGFGLAQSMGADTGKRLIGHGTLYKALGRLEDMGLLSSHWEHDPPAGRPRRRLYELTAAGAKAAVTPATTKGPTVRPRLSPGPA